MKPAAVRPAGTSGQSSCISAPSCDYAQVHSTWGEAMGLVFTGEKGNSGQFELLLEAFDEGA
jgi:hypothetical protein